MRCAIQLQRRNLQAAEKTIDRKQRKAGEDSIKKSSTLLGAGSLVFHRDMLLLVYVPFILDSLLRQIQYHRQHDIVN